MYYCDLETYLFGPDTITPKPIVIASFQDDEAPTLNPLWGPEAEPFLREILSRESCWHNAAFDLNCLYHHFPGLRGDIWKALDEERIYCTKVQEKMLVLQTTGDLEFETLPDGSKKRRLYSYADLVKRYVGEDISEGKKDPNSWRYRYAELERVPISQWPSDAVKYVLTDILHLPTIFHAQRKKATRFGPYHFRVTVDFCLYMIGSHGLWVDPDQVRSVKQELEQILSPERMEPLYQRGLLARAIPETPSRVKSHVEGCKRKKDCTCPHKMKKAVPEKLNLGFLRALALELESKGFEIEKTAKGFPSVGKDFLHEFSSIDPDLELLEERQSVQKILTTEIPRLEWPRESGNPAAVVYPAYDCLKETGRVSSYSADGYPSMNCTNMKASIRRMIKAPEGFWLFSIDFSQMELCTLAQTCFRLFGHSKLKDLINEGIDVHAYLGAQLCSFLEPKFGNWGDSLRNYQAFAMLKSGTDEEKALYKKFRTFAKPTNLGYPGGLGPQTFITYAKATYGVTVESVEQAKMLREIWLNTFPEMREYFAYINTQCLMSAEDIIAGQKAFEKGQDLKAKKAADKGEEEPERQKYRSVYRYMSPFGMIRPYVDYCAAANGLGLQTPGAEGALTALTMVVHDSTNPVVESDIFDKIVVLAFIHDEILGLVEANPDTAGPILAKVQKIMEFGMGQVCPDVSIRTNPALMLNWYKEAEAVYDEKGRLTPWLPKK